MTFIFTFIFGGALFLRFSGEKNNTFELGEGFGFQKSQIPQIPQAYISWDSDFKPLLILGILYPLALVWP